ncbi:S1 RNA binding domain protein [Leptospira interrogans str. 2002000626]|nr:S1 RNA binding domain protein [Leptospira interrogans str. 2002000626]
MNAEREYKSYLAFLGRQKNLNILLSSGTGNLHVYPGIGGWKEMEILSGVLGNQETIRIATESTCSFIEAPHEGKIQEGKPAFINVFTEDPFIDLKNLKTLQRIIAGEIYYDLYKNSSNRKSDLHGKKGQSSSQKKERKTKMKESEKELFEKMLDASFKKKKAMEAGTKITAIVNSAKKDFVFVTAKEGKLPGIISSEEFMESGLPNPGEELEAYFLKEDHGDVHFTTCLSGDLLNKDLLEIAKKAEIPVLGQFVSEGDSGADVKIGEFSGFCPFSQIDPELKKSGLIGKRLKFLIQDFGNRNKLVVSQKKISDRAKEAKLGVLKQELKEGMFVTCKVKTIQNFGLIVEMDGGVTALVPISEATYKKNPELEKEFQVGQTLRARVLRIDWENQKFALTVKDFLKDPWAQTVPFKEGDIVKGTIDSLKPFGVFVKLDDHFNGLVPGRETGISNRVPLSQSFKPGEVVDVFVMEVNPEKKQISLSIQKAKEIQERMDYSSYLSVDTSGSTSSFGAILQNSLNKNKKK